MITCYLDSQDYSVLTDPKSATPARTAVREQLLELARSKQVQFVYSGAIISEAAPLTVGAVHLAERRGDLLSELCGRNALVSLDRLLAREAKALRLRTSQPLGMLDSEGRWHPEVSMTGLNLWDDLYNILDAMPDIASLPRQQRRAAVRKLVKNGQPTSALRAHLLQHGLLDSLVESLLVKLPLAPEYADVLRRYVLGRTSEKEVADALKDSLREPSSVMRWFATDFALASPMADMIRAPGRELAGIFCKFVEHSKALAEELRESGVQLDPASPTWQSDPTARGGRIAGTWERMPNNQLMALMGRIVRRDDPQRADGITAAEVDQYCAGDATAVQSLFASSWASVGGGRKDLPSDSQPVDALHACYAPYVDVFRADRFMAEFIRREAKRHGTTVVADLMKLPEILRERLASAR